MGERGLPPEVQQALAQYQALRESYARMDNELRLIEAELAEVENTLDSVASLADNVELYKMVGHVLFRKTKEEVVKELNERKELLSIKRDKYRRQLEILSSQINELENKIRSLLTKYGLGAGQQKQG
ncbi:MAG: prefoldin subunit beta [Desulfurococcaceae archaeon]